MWSLARLQVCGRCGHSWYPRGHWRSAKCPQCGTTVLQTSSSSSTGCSTVILWLLGGFLVFGVLGQVSRAAGPGGVMILLVLVVGAWIGVAVLKRRARLKREEEQRLLAAAQNADFERQVADRFQDLVQRFGEVNANRIVGKTLWQGATAEMIHEMLGTPENVSSKVLKTLKRDVWKYNRLDARRYGLQVTLENEVCVGWKTAGE
jgi:hypothetical protein